MAKIASFKIIISFCLLGLIVTLFKFNDFDDIKPNNIMISKIFSNDKNLNQVLEDNSMKIFNIFFSLF